MSASSRYGGVEVMDVSLSGLPPRTAFELFVVQLPNAPFGMSWYQGDIETNATGWPGPPAFRRPLQQRDVHGRAGQRPGPGAPSQRVPGRAVEPGHRSAAPVPPRAVVRHARRTLSSAGCPGDVTPFNGEHNAGIQAMSTRNFGDLIGPLQEITP
jgi:hypothetical protein